MCRILPFNREPLAEGQQFTDISLICSQYNGCTYAAMIFLDSFSPTNQNFGVNVKFDESEFSVWLLIKMCANLILSEECSDEWQFCDREWLMEDSEAHSLKQCYSAQDNIEICMYIWGFKEVKPTKLSLILHFKIIVSQHWRSFSDQLHHQHLTH